MRILIIDGHPDIDSERLSHALAKAYELGARRKQHEVRTITLAEKDIPFLRSRSEWEKGTPSQDIAAAQEDMKWANHMVIIYPLWLGDIPAYLKAFFEQVARPGFAIAPFSTGGGGLLKGKSARIIVTMGMPAFVYRWFFLAHSLKSLKRNILQFVGIKPVRYTIIGMVEKTNKNKLLEKVSKLGEAAA